MAGFRRYCEQRAMRSSIRKMVVEPFLPLQRYLIRRQSSLRQPSLLEKMHPPPPSDPSPINGEGRSTALRAMRMASTPTL